MWWWDLSVSSMCDWLTVTGWSKLQYHFISPRYYSCGCISAYVYHYALPSTSFLESCWSSFFRQTSFLSGTRRFFVKVGLLYDKSVYFRYLTRFFHIHISGFAWYNMVLIESKDAHSRVPYFSDQLYIFILAKAINNDAHPEFAIHIYQYCFSSYSHCFLHKGTSGCWCAAHACGAVYLCTNVAFELVRHQQWSLCVTWPMRMSRRSTCEKHEHIFRNDFSTWPIETIVLTPRSTSFR